MGKDFKTGLICGLVLVVVALIWVATRPSLTPQARMLGPATASSRDSVLPPGANPQAPDDRQQPRETLPPGLIPAEPEASRTPTTVPDAVQSEPLVASQPDAPDLTIYEQQEKIRTTKFHIVRKDETLSSISRQYYGTPNKWQKILQANRQTIKDADKITPGTKLIIPD